MCSRKLVDATFGGEPPASFEVRHEHGTGLHSDEDVDLLDLGRLSPLEDVRQPFVVG